MRPSRTREEKGQRNLYMDENELKREFARQAEEKRRVKQLQELQDREETLNYYRHNNPGEEAMLAEKFKEITQARAQLESQDPDLFIKFNEEKPVPRKEKVDEYLKKNFDPNPQNNFLFHPSEGGSQQLSKGEIERQKRLQLREQERQRRLNGNDTSAYEGKSLQADLLHNNQPTEEEQRKKRLNNLFDVDAGDEKPQRGEDRDPHSGVLGMQRQQQLAGVAEDTGFFGSDQQQLQQQPQSFRRPSAQGGSKMIKAERINRSIDVFAGDLPPENNYESSEHSEHIKEMYNANTQKIQNMFQVPQSPFTQQQQPKQSVQQPYQQANLPFARRSNDPEKLPAINGTSNAHNNNKVQSQQNSVGTSEADLKKERMLRYKQELDEQKEAKNRIGQHIKPYSAQPHGRGASSNNNNNNNNGAAQNGGGDNMGGFFEKFGQDPQFKRNMQAWEDKQQRNIQSQQHDQFKPYSAQSVGSAGTSARPQQQQNFQESPQFIRRQQSSNNYMPESENRNSQANQPSAVAVSSSNPEEEQKQRNREKQRQLREELEKQIQEKATQKRQSKRQEELYDAQFLPQQQQSLTSPKVNVVPIAFSNELNTPSSMGPTATPAAAAIPYSWRNQRGDEQPSNYPAAAAVGENLGQVNTPSASSNKQNNRNSNEDSDAIAKAKAQEAKQKYANELKEQMQANEKRKEIEKNKKRVQEAYEYQQIQLHLLNEQKEKVGAAKQVNSASIASNSVATPTAGQFNSVNHQSQMEYIPNSKGTIDAAQSDFPQSSQSREIQQPSYDRLFSQQQSPPSASIMNQQGGYTNNDQMSYGVTAAAAAPMAGGMHGFNNMGQPAQNQDMMMMLLLNMQQQQQAQQQQQQQAQVQMMRMMQQMPGAGFNDMLMMGGHGVHGGAGEMYAQRQQEMAMQKWIFEEQMRMQQLGMQEKVLIEEYREQLNRAHKETEEYQREILRIQKELESKTGHSIDAGVMHSYIMTSSKFTDVFDRKQVDKLNSVSRVNGSSSQSSKNLGGDQQQQSQQQSDQKIVDIADFAETPAYLQGQRDVELALMKNASILPSSTDYVANLAGLEESYLRDLEAFRKMHSSKLVIQQAKVPDQPSVSNSSQFASKKMAVDLPGNTFTRIQVQPGVEENEGEEELLGEERDVPWDQLGEPEEIVFNEIPVNDDEEVGGYPEDQEDRGGAQEDEEEQQEEGVENQQSQQEFYEIQVADSGSAVSVSNQARNLYYYNNNNNSHHNGIKGMIRTSASSAWPSLRGNDEIIDQGGDLLQESSSKPAMATGIVSSIANLELQKTADYYKMFKQHIQEDCSDSKIKQNDDDDDDDNDNQGGAQKQDLEDDEEEEEEKSDPFGDDIAKKNEREQLDGELARRSIRLAINQLKQFDVNFKDHSDILLQGQSDRGNFNSGDNSRVVGADGESKSEYALQPKRDLNFTVDIPIKKVVGHDSELGETQLSQEVTLTGRGGGGTLKSTGGIGNGTGGIMHLLNQHTNILDVLDEKEAEHKESGIKSNFSQKNVKSAAEQQVKGNSVVAEKVKQGFQQNQSGTQSQQTSHRMPMIPRILEDSSDFNRHQAEVGQAALRILDEKSKRFQNVDYRAIQKVKGQFADVEIPEEIVQNLNGYGSTISSQAERSLNLPDEGIDQRQISEFIDSSGGVDRGVPLPDPDDQDTLFSESGDAFREKQIADFIASSSNVQQQIAASHQRSKKELLAGSVRKFNEEANSAGSVQKVMSFKKPKTIDVFGKAKSKLREGSSAIGSGNNVGTITGVVSGTAMTNGAGMESQYSNVSISAIEGHEQQEQQLLQPTLIMYKDAEVNMTSKSEYTQMLNNPIRMVSMTRMEDQTGIHNNLMNPSSVCFDADDVAADARDGGRVVSITSQLPLFVSAARPPVSAQNSKRIQSATASRRTMNVAEVSPSIQKKSDVILNRLENLISDLENSNISANSVVDEQLKSKQQVKENSSSGKITSSANRLAAKASFNTSIHDRVPSNPKNAVKRS